MRPCNFDKLTDLSDLFCAIIGGNPDSLEEIDEFLQKSPLSRLLSNHDFEKVVKYGGYFSEEQIDGIYALLPVEITLKKNHKTILYPKELRQLNKRTEQQAGSRVINISFDKVFSIYITHFDNKVKNVLKRRAEIQKEKELKEQQLTMSAPLPSIRQEDTIQQEQPKDNFQNTDQTENSSKPLKKKKKVSSLERALAYQRNHQAQKQKEIQKQAENNKEQIIKKLYPIKTKTKQTKPKDVCAPKGVISNQTQQSKAHEEEIKKEQITENNVPLAPQQIESDDLPQTKKSSYNKEAYQRRRQNMSEEQLSAERAKNAERMRLYRQQHPEKIKSYYVKYEDLSEEEKEKKRAQNREKNKKYREIHRVQIRQKDNERRAKLKAENPELLKALDKKNNLRADRKKICRTYYQKHKAELIEKSQKNPKKNIYKQRYKVKIRLKEKTGPILLSLLQGIIANKNRR